MAATCIPSAIEPRSVGERTTWEQLRDNCPTNWLIFSNCYVRKDPKVASLYREADIIVIANKRIFVIEIKDGKHFESSKGEWYREGNLIRNPITQVNSLKGMLLSILKRVTGENMQVVPLVVLPRCAALSVHVPPPGALFVMAQDIKNLASILQKEDSSAKNTIRSEDKDKIVQEFTPTFRTLPSQIMTRVDLDNAFAYPTFSFSSIESNNKIHIIGAGGTGKTAMAKSQALRLAKRGGRPLIVCDNQILSEQITNELGSYGITCTTLSNITQHGLTGVERYLLNKNFTALFWLDTQDANDLNSQYSYVTLLDWFTSKNLPVRVFSDPVIQGLGNFTSDRTGYLNTNEELFSDNWVNMHLSNNCRNSSTVATWLEEITGVSLYDQCLRQDSTPIEVVDRWRGIKEILEQELAKDPLTPITVLTTGSLGRAELFLKEYGTFTGKVSYQQAQQAKGLEFDKVVIDAFDVGNYKYLAYLCASRALGGLTVISG